MFFLGGVLNVWVGGEVRAGNEVWGYCVRQQLKTCAVNPKPIRQHLFGCTGFKFVKGQVHLCLGSQSSQI